VSIHPPAEEETVEPVRSDGYVWLWLLVLPVGLLFAFGILFPKNRVSVTEARSVAIALPTADGERVERGRHLAEKICASCHAFPDPALASRYDWAFGILPGKAVWLGLTPFNHRAHPGGDRVVAAKIFPSEPVLSRADWLDLSSYYLAVAPISLPGPAGTELNESAAIPFQVDVISYRREPDIGAVAIDSGGGVLYAGNAEDGELDVISLKGEQLASQMLGRPIVGLAQTTDAIFITSIGTLAPSDIPGGEVTYLSKPNAANPQRRAMAQRLMRPAGTEVGDLNQDGIADLIIGEQGHYLGQVMALVSQGKGEYLATELVVRSGAVRSRIVDLDGAGNMAIVVMMGGAREGLYLYELGANGSASMRPIVERHPAWDSAWFEADDLDGDGNVDLVTGNGGLPAERRLGSGLRDYHGLHFYRGDGKGGFAPAGFTSLEGVWRLEVADFDNDGDRDVLVLAAPDYVDGKPGAGLMILKNDGNFGFVRTPVNGSEGAPWNAVAIGDVDRDGDFDILVGASKRRLKHSSPWLRMAWRKNPMPLRLFRNQTVN
jgi:hypothetical protein